MLVANSFDLWQKDTFFSAAEEVQQSADIMESAYRTWLRARREGVMPQHLDELSRELQMALGTAKWQLEEFERAVRLSYRNNGDDITITRHSQFVSAIEDQISRAETALKESLNVEGKKPFQWVNLDEEECDDLALFLSGTPETSQRIKDEGVTLSVSDYKEDRRFGPEVCPKAPIQKHGTSSEEVKSNDDPNCIIELRESRFSEKGDGIAYQADQITSNRRAWSSPDRIGLEIVVDSDDGQMNGLTDATPKEKGFRPFFWRPRGDNLLGVKGAPSHTQMKLISWINQFLSCSTRLKLSPVLDCERKMGSVFAMVTVSRKRKGFFNSSVDIDSRLTCLCAQGPLPH